MNSAGLGVAVCPLDPLVVIVGPHLFFQHSGSPCPSGLYSIVCVGILFVFVLYI